MLRYLFLVICLFAIAVSPVFAATIRVDGTDCNLRNAILAAENDEATGGCSAGNGADTITISTDVTLNPLPSITTEITIDGNDHTISGDGQFSAFYISGGTLKLSDLTISDAYTATQGGALYVNGGDLTLENVKVKDSVAGDVGGGLYALDSNVVLSNSEFTGNSTRTSHGGGMYFASSTGDDTLNIVASVFRNNQAIEDGGALKVARGIVSIVKSSFANNTADEGGAIESSNAELSIENSTFSANTAREGGGISSFDSDITLTHVTLAYNSAEEQGGGLAVIGWTGTVKLRNTLITDNPKGGDCHPGLNPDSIVEFTGNFIQDGSCTPNPNEGEDTEAQHVIGSEEEENEEPLDALIEALTGDLPHHPLLWGSPAIDNGDPDYCLDVDQPNTDRPQYRNCDIGAYEYPEPPPTPTPRPPTNTPKPRPTSTRSPDQSPPDTAATSIPDDLPPSTTPTKTSVPPTLTLPPHCIHRVSAGENLYRIALRYDMTVREISSFNSLLRDDKLVEGQELVIPWEDCVLLVPRKG